MTKRGIRNNNPGNIEAGAPWQGLTARDQTTLGQTAEDRFAVFQSPKWGIRAIARTLITYQDKHGLRSVKAMIDRWAPPVENNTAAYIKAVEGKVGAGEIDVHTYATMNALIRAIILHENGIQPYTDAQITAGLVLAGIEPPQRSLRKSGTVRGGRVATVTSGITAATGALAAIAPALPVLDYIKENLWLLGVLGAIGLAATGYMIWRRVDDRRRGLR